MDTASKRAIIALPIILLIAVGLAVAGAQGGYIVWEMPLFALCVALAFIIQWIAFIPAFFFQTEKFFDLTGSITYLTVVLVGVALSQTVDLRSLLLLVLISIWAIRLGSFLFLRIQAAGEDQRFRDIKTSFSRFLLTWTLQGLWVSFSLAAALAAITTQTRLPLDGFALIGSIIWFFGFGIEVIADKQKSLFRSQAMNKGKFINVGLWSWSRHPNYFGEILLWIGIAIIALPVLVGWQLVTLVSPIFVILLLTRISGIPMLEASADARWGGQKDYESYKSGTSILIPKPPSTTKREILGE